MWRCDLEMLIVGKKRYQWVEHTIYGKNYLDAYKKLMSFLDSFSKYSTLELHITFSTLVN